MKKHEMVEVRSEMPKQLYDLLRTDMSEKMLQMLIDESLRVGMGEILGSRDKEESEKALRPIVEEDMVKIPLPAYITVLAKKVGLDSGDIVLSILRRGAEEIAKEILMDKLKFASEPPKGSC